VVKAAKVARTAARAAPAAAATAPVAAGGLGFIVLGLGLWWLVNKATQLPTIIGDKIQDLPEAVGKIDIPGVPDIPPVHVWVPDVIESVPDWDIPGVPDIPPVHVWVPDVVQSVPEWDIPGVPELAPVWEWFPDVGPTVTRHYEEAGPSLFTGKIPGGPKFDLLSPFRGLFGGQDDPQARDLKYRGEAIFTGDLLYRGEPVETVTLPFMGGPTKKMLL